MAEALLESETLTGDEIETLLAGGTVDKRPKTPAQIGDEGDEEEPQEKKRGLKFPGLGVGKGEPEPDPA